MRAIDGSLFLRQLIRLTSLMGNMAAAHKTSLPTADTALPGRDGKVTVSSKHTVNSNPTVPPFPDNMKLSVFGMGCFWGAERKFWTQPGVFSTQVGYASGYTANPSYKEVCSGDTGHAEVVRVVFDPAKIQYADLLAVFWESHNPTQGMRQGNDVGTQYRSGIYCHDDEQRVTAEASRDAYQRALTDRGIRDKITTEILPVGEFFYAEDYHQQYLHKNPGGYCGLSGTGVACPRGIFAKDTNGVEAKEKKSEL